MSASLVGSEMCIRDRSSPRTRAARAASARQMSSTQKVCSTMVSTARPPVSYTHLTLPTICSV
eukprot:4406752-Alexandrium_andersonii.AAC.1